MAAIVMTLSVLEGHSPVACLFKSIFRICCASRGLSACVELLVKLCKQTDKQSDVTDHSTSYPSTGEEVTKLLKLYRDAAAVYTHLVTHLVGLTGVPSP